MEPEFRHWLEFEGWDGAADAVATLIDREQARRVLEVGSGAHPTLSVDTVAALDLDYTTNDVSAAELAKADSRYSTLLLDISRDELPAELVGRFDLVFSRMVNEHVRDGEQYYRSIERLLRPGGVTAHWFSTLYAAPMIVNRVLPESIAGRLFDRGAREDHHDRFRAYYSWSRGPSMRAIKRFKDLGFVVERYIGYFGHDYYRGRAPRLHPLEHKKSGFLVRHPIASLCSYAHIVLRKPLNPSTSTRTP